MTVKESNMKQKPKRIREKWFIYQNGNWVLSHSKCNSKHWKKRYINKHFSTDKNVADIHNCAICHIL